MGQSAPNPAATTAPLSAPTREDPITSALRRDNARRVTSVFSSLVLDKARPDLTTRQTAILALVVAAPGEETVKRMAAALDVHKPAVTRGLDRLEELGLAKRSTSTTDRRVCLARPTAEGVAWITAAAALIRGA